MNLSLWKLVSSKYTFGVFCYSLGVMYEKYYKMDSVKAKELIPANTDASLSSKPPFSSVAAKRSQEIMRFGFPSFDSLKMMDDYVLAYDRRTRNAFWVFEHLNESNVLNTNDVDRKKCDFVDDRSIHPFFRSTNDDYRRSGYDRGHMAAAGNHKKSQSDCEQTFFLSNISPQVGPGFNRGIWNKLERYTRKLLKTYPNVYVCTGPLFLPKKEANGKTYVKYEVIGKNHVAVPTHYFKVIVGESHDHQLDVEAYVMPNQEVNDKTPLKSYQVPIEAIERSAGFLLFEKIPRSSFRKINP